MTHETYIEKHVGPVVVSHRQDEQIDLLIQTLTQQKDPYALWKTVDGREHALWRVSKGECDLGEKFDKIEALYILDGHHRLEAASQNYLLTAKKREADLWIQAIIYSSDYVMVHPQHRVLLNVPENVQIVQELLNMEHLEITELTFAALKEVNIREELYRCEVVLKLYEKLYAITFKRGFRNILEKVPSFRLQNEIFTSFLGEEMLKLKYVPGIIDQEKVTERDIVFFVREPEIETIFQIADESVTMPPKSTWIEPKPCSHMVVRMLN